MTNTRALHRRKLVVESREELTDTVTAFMLRDAGGLPIDCEPGQHIALEIPVQPEPQVRSYSIVSSPQKSMVEIFVKLASPHGGGQWLRQNATVGTELSAHEPQGAVRLRELSGSAAFLAAGSGVAGVLMLVAQAAETGMRIQVFHADDNQASRVGADRLQRSVDQAAPGSTYDFHSVSERGFVDEHSLVPWFRHHQPDWVYLCGPPEFMRAARGAASTFGVPAHHVVAESYG